jgi:hypothetical protein
MQMMMADTAKIWGAARLTREFDRSSSRMRSLISYIGDKDLKQKINEDLDKMESTFNKLLDNYEGEIIKQSP